jgi:ubiquinone/menaquinone biosynthesis C-methylase UbiE
MKSGPELQREYYAKVASSYDAMHSAETRQLAFAFLAGAIEASGYESLLDVGSGTGHAMEYLGRRVPQVRAVGIEPVQALREVGHAKGIAPDQLVGGDGTALDYPDGSFDVVSSFAVLHHVPDPRRVVAEMLRVARRAVFIADSNNFGQGPRPARLAKQLLHACGLWPLANLVKTRGRGYIVTEGDGVSYSYSVFSSLPQIRAACDEVHFLNLSNSSPNLYRDAESVALLALKKAR